MKTPAQWLSWWQSQDTMDEAQSLEMIARIQRDAQRSMTANANARLLDWCAAWLIRARLTLYREGWEEGQSESEMLDDLTSVLANLGCDEGTGSPEHVKEHARLMKLPVTYSPPRVRRGR